MAAPRRARRLRRTIRLAQLELLAAMNDGPTLNAAAAAARMTQPAASRLLRALADDLGIELFRRSGRTLRPTAAGNALLQRASSFVADLDRIQSEVEAIDRGLAGTVSLGSGVAACYTLVPMAVSRLVKATPNITVALREGGMDELMTRLREGRIDLLVGRIDAGDTGRDLNIEELYDPPMTIVCGPMHPLARKRKLQWSDIVEAQWILPEAGTPMRAGIEGVFRRLRQRPRECVVESSSIQSNVSLLGRHDLLWVVSADIARYFETLGVLRLLPLPAMKGPSPFVLICSRTRPLSPAAQRLAHALRDAAKELTRHRTTRRT